jgi:hypothetical protein
VLLATNKLLVRALAGLVLQNASEDDDPAAAGSN